VLAVIDPTAHAAGHVLPTHITLAVASSISIIDNSFPFSSGLTKLVLLEVQGEEEEEEGSSIIRIRSLLIWITKKAAEEDPLAAKCSVQIGGVPTAHACYLVPDELVEAGNNISAVQESTWISYIILGWMDPAEIG
jgi:hypothetical protein